MHFDLTPFSSLCLSVLFAFLFVISLYIWRKSTLIDRDEPQTIKQRLFSVTSVCLIVPCILTRFIDQSDKQTDPSFLTLIGIPDQFINQSIFLPLLHTAALFTGPLFLTVLSNPSPIDYIRHVINSINECRSSERKSLIALRNLIAAPITEEFVFRACMCSVMINGGWPMSVSLLTSPLLFGAAHLHHLIGLVRAKGYSIQQGVVAVVFQLAHTTLFGLYTAYVFIVTGNVLTVILCHTFCNLMEFPDLQWASSPYHPHHGKRIPVFIAFITGIVAFIYLWPICLDPALYDSYFMHVLNDHSSLMSSSTETMTKVPIPTLETLAPFE